MSYIKKYYNYQTQARSLLDQASLTKRFKKLTIFYNATIKSHIPAEINANCADLPCGFGNILFYLRSKGFQKVIGVDLDPKQIELAKLLDLNAMHGDVFEFLNSLNGGLDLITSFDFIEHINKQQSLDFLELCFAKLNNGGRIILRTPSADGPFGAHDANNDLTHEWSMSANLLETMLRMIGFKKIEIIDEYPRPSTIFGLIRWLVYLPSISVAKLFCIAIGIRPPRIWSRSMIAVAYK